MNNEDERERCMKISRERGDFVQGDDGYVVYWPNREFTGALAAHHLRWLADELDELNKAWDEIVQNDPRISG